MLVTLNMRQYRLSTEILAKNKAKAYKSSAMKSSSFASNNASSSFMPFVATTSAM
jgi:hypothetical protein